MSIPWASLFPSLLAAGGILASTSVAAAGRDPAAAGMAGGAVLAASLVGAVLIDVRFRGRHRAQLVLGALAAVVTLVATGLVVAVEPERVAQTLPLLGAGLAVIVVSDRNACRGRKRERPAGTEQRPAA